MANSDNKFFLIVVITAVAIIGGIFFFTSKNKTSSGDDVPNINVTDGRKRGADDSAKVKIVEFGDFQCPACKAAEPELMSAIDKNSSDTQLIFRNFPLAQHKNALTSAQAAEAAGEQGKYWEMHDLLYENQDAWSNLTDPESIFTGYARQLELDIDKFKADYKNETLAQKIQDDLSYGESIAVNQTPTFFVNGKRVVGGQTAAQWQELIDNAKK